MTYFTHVFVLCSGRCASKTLATALEHVPGWTSGHESTASMVGLDRLRYPVNHIETDNRLVWFLPMLYDLYPDALYVHLTRPRSDVQRSFERRPKSRIIRAFGDGLTTRIVGVHNNTPAKRRAVIDWYLDTVDYNIKRFMLTDLSGKMDRKLEIDTSDFQTGVAKLLDRLNVDDKAARKRVLSELQVRHNATITRAET